MDDGKQSATLSTVQPDIEREVATLHQAHAGALLRFASTFTPDEGACGDAVQEAFLRYLVERRFGGAIANPRAWLYQVVRNYLLDRMKGAATRREVAVEHAESVHVRQRSPELIMERSETAREIAAALSVRELECLRLRSEGLSYQEIGEVLMVSAGTVAALLARVHVKLRKLGAVERGWTFAETREALRYLVCETSA